MNLIDENLMYRKLLTKALSELNNLTHTLAIPDEDGSLVDSTSHFQIKIDIRAALYGRE